MCIRIKKIILIIALLSNPYMGFSNPTCNCQSTKTSQDQIEQDPFTILASQDVFDIVSKKLSREDFLNFIDSWKPTSPTRKILYENRLAMDPQFILEISNEYHNYKNLSSAMRYELHLLASANYSYFSDALAFLTDTAVVSNEQLKNIIYISVYLGLTDLTKELIKKSGLAKSIKDWRFIQNWNLLHVAARGNRASMINLLIKLRVDPNALDIENRSPADIARLKDKQVTLKSLQTLNLPISHRVKSNSLKEKCKFLLASICKYKK